jgi:hypothetical protein
MNHIVLSGLIVTGCVTGYAVTVAIAMGLIRRFDIADDNDWALAALWPAALTLYSLVGVIIAPFVVLHWLINRPFNWIVNLVHNGLPRKPRKSTLPKATVRERKRSV